MKQKALEASREEEIEELRDSIYSNVADVGPAFALRHDPEQRRNARDLVHEAIAEVRRLEHLIATF